MKIVFATNNINKLREIKQILEPKFQIISLKELGIVEEIPENKDTIEGNASEKSNYIFKKFNIDCFADDTGLEIESLNGAPGVYSARYAGKPHNYRANCQKVLKELNGIKNRKARFKTVISLIFNGDEYLFEGIINGEILSEERGEGGFGYDPVFKPDGYDFSFAEMTADMKNSISHRALAVKKLAKFLMEI